MSADRRRADRAFNAASMRAEVLPPRGMTSCAGRGEAGGGGGGGGKAGDESQAPPRSGGVDRGALSGPAPPSPSAAPDAIKRILKAWEAKDYFGLLQLPPPSCDDLGRPEWGCTPGDVSRAYRKLSVLVHPDKNPGEQARKAFEALNAAHRSLKDPDLLFEVLRSAADRLRREREQSEARSTVAERIQLNATKTARQRELRKEEGRSFHDTIAQQMKRKQEEMKRKADAAEQSRAAELRKADARGGGDSDSGSSDSGAAAVVRKKRRPGFM